MVKLINSETTYQTDTTQLKVGTTNKKNPKTIYIETRCYITPNEKKKGYAEDISHIITDIEKSFKGILKNSENFEDYYTFFSDIALDRVKYSKPSFLVLSAYVQVNESFFNETKRSFSEIAEYAKSQLLDAFENTVNYLFAKENFSISRTKSED